MVKSETVNKLVEEALAIETAEAKEAGAVGYMARLLVQATMPHSRTEGAIFKRYNGAYTLTMLADPDIGLPYGTKPRLLMSWLTTEVVRTGERTITLGESLSDFMRQLGLVPTGGRWGTITSLRDQTKRLFACSVKAVYADKDRWSLDSVNVADHVDLWWNPRRPDQLGLWASSVTLSARFFESVSECPVPVDMRVLRALSRSPLALDIYCWLTYRMSYLKKQTVIPWPALEVQFGSDYQETRVFKHKFLMQLKKILLYYDVNVEDGGEGLCLKPSLPHIRRE